MYYILYLGGINILYIIPWRFGISAKLIYLYDDLDDQ